MKIFLLAFLLAAPISAQVTTTTYVGTVKDLTGNTITSGRITWQLNAPTAPVIPGKGAFVSTIVSCLINASGLPVSTTDGVSPCVVTNNTALTPSGTSYRMCYQPYNITPGSCIGTFANGGTVDISTIVPTPTTQPNYGVSVTDLTARAAAAAAQTTANAALPANGLTSSTSSGGSLTVPGTAKIGSSVTGGPKINVQFWGAVADGTTNNATAINNAITAASVLGGSVYFPPSNHPYIVNSTITVPCGVGKIEGEGYEQAIGYGSIIQGGASLNAPVLVVGGTSSSICKGMTIQDLAINGNGTQTADIMDINPSEFYRIRSLFVGLGTGTCVKVNQVWDMDWTGGYIHDCGSGGATSTIPALDILAGPDLVANNLYFRGLDVESWQGIGVRLLGSNGKNVAQVHFDFLKDETALTTHGRALDIESAGSVTCTPCHIATKDLSGSTPDYTVFLHGVNQMTGIIGIEQISGSTGTPTSGFGRVESSDSISLTSMMQPQVGLQGTYTGAAFWIVDGASSNDVQIAGAPQHFVAWTTLPMVSPNRDVIAPSIPQPERTASDFSATAISGASSFSPFLWYLGSATTDQKRWDWFQDASTLKLRACDDAYSSCNSALLISRSGNTINSVAANAPLSWGSGATISSSDVVCRTDGTHCGRTTGSATLVSGTVTVSNAAACAIGASCIYKLTRCAPNSSTAIGSLSVGTISAGTSFVINSLSATNTVATGDLSMVCWQIN